jgi:hypothetical protein
MEEIAWRKDRVTGGDVHPACPRTDRPRIVPAWIELT